MNTIQKSEAIKNSLRKGFQDGSSKMAKRKCYGYDVGPDGELAMNPEEAQVVCWIFEQYLAGNSLGKIASGLERQGIPSPIGRPKLKMMASWIGIFTPTPMGPLFLMRYSWRYSGKSSTGLLRVGKAALLACAVDLGSRRVVIFPQEQPLDLCIFLFGNGQLRSIGQDHTKTADLPHMGGVEQITGMYAKKSVR